MKTRQLQSGLRGNFVQFTAHQPTYCCRCTCKYLRNKRNCWNNDKHCFCAPLNEIMSFKTRAAWKRMWQDSEVGEKIDLWPKTRDKEGRRWDNKDVRGAAAIVHLYSIAIGLITGQPDWDVTLWSCAPSPKCTAGQGLWKCGDLL